MANRPKVDKEDGNNSDANASDPDEDETAFDRRKKEHLTKQAAAAAEPKAVVVTVKDPAANAAKNAARNQGSLLTPARAEEIELWKGLEFADSTVRWRCGDSADPADGSSPRDQRAPPARPWRRSARGHARQHQAHPAAGGGGAVRDADEACLDLALPVYRCIVRDRNKAVQ